MRVRNNFKEDKNEELKEKIRVTLLIAALTVTPAAIVHKIENDKLEIMSSYYETVLEEEREKAYMEGYLDGLFGKEDNFFTPVEKTIEAKDLVIKIPEEEQGKKLVYTKKNIKY
ncbi:MAG: hypothetical protein IJG97_01885 [Bacilli bacterium]|nr:hypothetical protein [Bacilli bacterium]